VTASQGPDASRYLLRFNVGASRRHSAHIAHASRSGQALYARYRHGLLITDTSVIVVVALAVLMVTKTPQSELPFTVLVTVVLAIALFANRSRSVRFIGTGASEYGRVIAASLFTFGLLAILVTLLDGDKVHTLFFFALPADTVLLVVGRSLWRDWLATQRVGGRNLPRALVVGSEAEVTTLVRRISSTPEPPYSVIGVVLDGCESRVIEVANRSIPVLAGLSTIATAVASTEADIVIVAGQHSGNQDFIRDLSWSLEETSAGLALASGLVDVANPRIHVRSVDGMPLMHVELPTFSGGKHVTKRSFDVVMSGLALLVLAPLFAVIAIAIKLDSRGTVLFRQERVGKDGRTFAMLKFRSMIPNAEDELTNLLQQNEGAGILFKLRKDPRVTRLGAFLRRYSLDELPQLWNIFVGDMSMVGPRPPLPREVSQYQASANRRLYIKPGLTGLWQVSGRSDLTWDQSIRLDLYYVANWSLVGDIHIMWRTVKVVLNPTGAY
jgi:exopolysaccharide biosynthesis polyprenyl glycosylphosphotransferase